MRGVTFGRRALSVMLGAVLALAFVAEAMPAPPTNLTVIVDKEDGTIYCKRMQWYDVCWFAFANYVLHALSVRSLPGDNNYHNIVFKICCLLVPYAGLRRGLCLISRASNLAGSDLQSAASANALCMVIRTPEWRPANGDIIEGCDIQIADSVEDHSSLSRSKSSSFFKLRTWGTTQSQQSEKSSGKTRKTEVGKLNRSDSTVARNAWRYRNHLKLEVKDTYHRPSCQNLVERVARVLLETYRFYTQNPSQTTMDHGHVKLHGYCELAPGYALCYIPADMKVYPRFTASMTDSVLHGASTKLGLRKSFETRIASAHNIPRLIFSLAQTISGGYALYKARGPQIQRYGFAAYGLTVIPYILVSIVNFFGALLTGEYETVFLVHSSIMDEMIERGGRADGAVGTVDAPINEIRETSCVAEEVRIEHPSKVLVFEEIRDSLRCHDNNEPSAPQSYFIFPYEPPVEKLKGTPRRGCRSRLSRVFEVIQWRSPTARKPPAKLPTSKIIIPSHPPFTRLPRLRYQTCLDLLCIALLFTTIMAPYLVIWLLTGFKRNHSESSQRNLLLNWLICGQVQGYAVGDVERLTSRSGALKGLLYVFLCYGSYFLGGFVIVAQEMIEFGKCKSY